MCLDLLYEPGITWKPNSFNDVIIDIHKESYYDICHNLNDQVLGFNEMYWGDVG